jgi:hypothetical protein
MIYDVTPSVALQKSAFLQNTATLQSCMQWPHGEKIYNINPINSIKKNIKKKESF